MTFSDTQVSQYLRCPRHAHAIRGTLVSERDARGTCTSPLLRAAMVFRWAPVTQTFSTLEPPTLDLPSGVL